MIKINVISNNPKWKNYINNPNTYIERKIKDLNRKNKTYKKKRIFCTLLLSNNIEIKKLNKNSLMLLEFRNPYLYISD